MMRIPSKYYQSYQAVSIKISRTIVNFRRFTTPELSANRYFKDLQLAFPLQKSQLVR
jgi:hypothetical protein